jgi:hypothetical protein
VHVATNLACYNFQASGNLHPSRQITDGDFLNFLKHRRELPSGGISFDMSSNIDMDDEHI